MVISILKSKRSMHRISAVILSVQLRSYAQGCKSAAGYDGSVHKTSHKHSRFSGYSELFFFASRSIVKWGVGEVIDFLLLLFCFPSTEYSGKIFQLTL